jgi:predicted lipid-binding transport protein (Tim44 family)
MAVDLIIYAVVAAVLVIWLRNTLGTRHGEERQRDNPLTGLDQNRTPADGKGRIVDITDAGSVALEPLASPFHGIDIADKAAEDGLKDIMRADRAFDPHRFIAGARDAFPMIVECFADGDTDTLQNLLSSSVYTAFAEVINERKIKGETVKTEIHAVRKATILEARTAERMTYIKIRFTAEETCVIRDREGIILSGNPDRITEMTDVWTFGRDTRSKDPTWLLVETSDDVVEDHKTPIPNAG